MSRLDKIKSSKSFQKANEKAALVLENKDQLSKLLTDSTEKLKQQGKEKHQDLWAVIKDAIDMLKAYVTGEYKQLPKKSILMLIAALIYFVMPLDFIPDFLMGFGLIDDIAVLGWTLSAIKSDIEAYSQWRSSLTGRSESTENPNEVQPEKSDL